MIIAMAADSFIQCRVSAAMKEALRAAAERQQLSESALVKRLIELMLYAAAQPDVTAVNSNDRPTRLARLYVRLSSGDWSLLRERAAGRCVAPATYVSNLIRAHVRAVSPLLKEELDALRRSVGALRAIGNNLNQIARVGHQSGHATGPNREDLRAMLKICEGLRDHVHGLMRANVLSWQSGDASVHH
jgi:Bacterial mobilisation protein (MobC)